MSFCYHSRMKRNILPLLVLGLVPLYAYSQGQAPYKPEVKVEIKEGYRLLTANGIPDHPTGRFPSRGNPNAISPQDYHFRIPLDPSPKPGQPARGAASPARRPGSGGVIGLPVWTISVSAEGRRCSRARSDPRNTIFTLLASHRVVSPGYASCSRIAVGIPRRAASQTTGPEA